MNPEYENIIHLAVNTVSLLQNNQITARIYGGVAVLINCPLSHDFFISKGRLPKDIDFICRYSELKKLRTILLNSGYVEKEESQFIKHKRQCFMKNGILLEFVFDELNYCHKIVLKNRLTDSYPTISIPDLFLSKIQNIKLSSSDILDICALLNEFDLTKYFERISDILCNDFGFYKTTIQNLDFIEEHVPNELLPIVKSIEKLKTKIVTDRKSIRWFIQKQIVNKNQWYNLVE